MSHEVQVHSAQTAILRELLFAPEAGFAQLQKPTGLTSNHFNFHVARLVELGLVEQVRAGRYRLTVRGKEYANRLDTDNNTVERQPKAVVLLLIERERAGRREFVFQQRLKHPYFGYWGRPTGKIRWGESIVESAARELMEETGLTADYKIIGMYHERVARKGTDEYLEDKLFFYVHCTNVRGELTAEFEGGHNAWMTREELERQELRFANFAEGYRIMSGEAVFLEGRREIADEAF